MVIYTIGHSTKRMEQLLDDLKQYNIELVIDVRRWPSSKKFPWFNKEGLIDSLNSEGIDYLHFPELGGFRKEGYINFVKSNEFTNALNRLIKIINDKIVTILCAELLWFRCHRRYIAQMLVERGYQVIHIFEKAKNQDHKPRSKEIEEKMELVIWCDKKAKKIKRGKFDTIAL
jgi:uncharacterized protein (DUF488 family)